jgi:hypothetical protein
VLANASEVKEIISRRRPPVKNPSSLVVYNLKEMH